MGTKSNPGAYDCYAHALPDEPMFVLLARDPTAAICVRDWARGLHHLINLGIKPESDRSKVSDALDCARAMEQWREANNGAWRTPKAEPACPT